MRTNLEKLGCLRELCFTLCGNSRLQQKIEMVMGRTMPNLTEYLQQVCGDYKRLVAFDVEPIAGIHLDNIPHKISAIEYILQATRKAPELTITPLILLEKTWETLIDIKADYRTLLAEEGVVE